MKQKKKKVLITGATGFIGRYLVEAAIANGFEVYITIRKSSRFNHLKPLGVQTILMDFTSEETIRQSFKKVPSIVFDSIIHNAGVKNLFKFEEFVRYNTQLTRDLCAAVQTLNLLSGQFIYISSLAASGPGNPETMEQITERKVAMPISAYGKSKLLAEQRIKESGIDYLILRPTAVYGKGTSDFKDVVLGIKTGVAVFFTSKQQTLSLIHAADLASICFACIDKGLKNDTFLLTDGKSYTIDTFNEILAKSTNSKIRWNIRIPTKIIRSAAYLQGRLRIKSSLNSTDKANEVLAMNWHCRSDKLYAATGYTIRHHLEDGIFSG